jgi:hypothetical protein
VIHLEPAEYAVAMIDSALRDARDGEGRLLRRAHGFELLDDVRDLLPHRHHSVLDHVDHRAESGSESIARFGFRQAGIDATPQVKACDGIRVDLLIGDRLVVEIGSFSHHGGREHYEHDRARLATLARLGYVVLDFTYKQVLFDWVTVLTTVLSAIARGDHVGRRMAW